MRDYVYTTTCSRLQHKPIRGDKFNGVVILLFDVRTASSSMRGSRAKKGHTHTHTGQDGRRSSQPNNTIFFLLWLGNNVALASVKGLGTRAK